MGAPSWLGSAITTFWGAELPPSVMDSRLTSGAAIPTP